AEVDEALALARRLPNALVMGENHGRRPPGFDFSNSPVAIAAADLAGRVLVQRTSAGTRGVLAAVDADEIYAASLVNASATARAVVRHGASPPTYVITGRFPDHPDGGDDDLLTAQLIERARLGEPMESAETARLVAATREADVTLALGGDDVHPDDVALATAVDRFDFAMRVQRVDGHMRLVREDVR
ncbi:MAG TPA: 2-phosphosulfolactate phosphatase, partial [Mycobacteriales bacterium]|nr:2-phosphosulfolactate phosphatase [Mycobacteriales bacterium]